MKQAILCNADVMKQNARILILTSKTGGGHISLAEALCERLENNYTVTIDDPQPKFFHLHYRIASRYIPALWSTEYRLSNTPARSLAGQKAFTMLVYKPIVKLLRQIQPHLVITTYSFFSYATALAIKSLGNSIPLALLFSDPKDVHSSWLTVKNVAAVFAPTSETQEQASVAGIASDRIHLTGWPVRRQFSQLTSFDRAEFLKRLNLAPDHFTVFVQGGSEGTAKFAKTVENLLAVTAQNSSSALQIILAIGSNRVLSKRFSNIRNVHLVPFTKDIAPYMAVSDVVIGKAGPNTLFESISLGKPFIATTYVPGQEEPNLELIKQYKLGWVALESHEQKQLFCALRNNNPELQEVIHAVEAYAQWNKTRNEMILPLIKSLMQSK